MGNLRKDILNAPNAITVARIGMIPLILAFTYYEGRVNSFVAGGLFAIVGATDFLDGWAARRTNTVTVVGKFLDPLADKLILMAVLIMLVHLGRVPAWLVILILAREFTVTGLRTMAMSEGIVIAAGEEGKYKQSRRLPPSPSSSSTTGTGWTSWPSRWTWTRTWWGRGSSTSRWPSRSGSAWVYIRDFFEGRVHPGSRSVTRRRVKRDGATENSRGRRPIPAWNSWRPLAPRQARRHPRRAPLPVTRLRREG